jgi:hypothetical protein
MFKRWAGVNLLAKALVTTKLVLNRGRHGSLVRVVPSHRGRVTRTPPQVHALFPCKLRCMHISPARA